MRSPPPPSPPLVLSASMLNTGTLTALANYYLTFSIIITIVGESLRSPNKIAGGDPETISCWSGSFLEDESGDSFDWLGLVK